MDSMEQLLGARRVALRKSARRSPPTSPHANDAAFHAQRPSLLNTETAGLV
jgi:hypothetical protein